MKKRLQRPIVKSIHSLEELLGLFIDPIVFFFLFQQFRREHRNKGQCNKRRNYYRSRNNDTELPEQASRHSFQEDYRKEYGDQRNGRGYNGKKYLFRTFHSRIPGRHSLFHFRINVFYYHDGIVHHQSHGKHHRKHGKHVDGKSRQIHDKECPDKRDGDNQCGNKRYTGISQEEEDYQHHQHKSNQNRRLHFGDGRTDKPCIIESDIELNIFRQVLAHLFYSQCSLVGNHNLIGPGLRNDHTADHRYTVTPEDIFPVFRIQFCRSDIAKPYDPVIVLDNHHVVKLFRGLHQPHGADRLLNMVSLDASGRQFNIFPVQGIFHIHGGNVIGCHSYRIEPQAHRIPVFSPNLHRTHVRDGLQTFLHGKLGYFGQLQQRACGAFDRNLHNRVGIGIGFGNRWRIRITRQISHSPGNLVAYIVGRRFQINTQFEFYSDAT